MTSPSLAPKAIKGRPSVVSRARAIAAPSPGAANDVDGDVVIEQKEMAYDAGGNLIRLEETGGTGELPSRVLGCMYHRENRLERRKRSTRYRHISGLIKKFSQS